MAGTYHLYGALKGGSAIVEAMLALAGADYEVTDFEWPDVYGSAPALLKVNPLGQIPALKLPDGSILIETAAIALHLAEQFPQAGFAPPFGDPQRPHFLRWLITLVADVYPTFTYGDMPERWVSGEAAQKELREKTNARCQELWQIIERDLAPGPWMLGDQFSALDIYASAMTRWRPRREWFAEHCPKVMAVALKVDEIPALKSVWQRHYG